MKYSTMLRELFNGVRLHARDLLLLESFQVAYLPDRVPQKEFAALLRSYPHVKESLMLKDPSIAGFFDSILKENPEISDGELIDRYCDEALWEIAELIVYNKFPELYDKKVAFNWTIDEIIGSKALKGKVVADVGAGSGQLAILLAPHAVTVFAIEPNSSFRSFLKQKVSKNGVSNLYVMDGLLELIPLPDNSLDMLFTSNAIGWNIEKELHEIERVVKPGGRAIHIIRIGKNLKDNPNHETLVSSYWNYEFSQTFDGNQVKVKYVKTV